MPRTICVYASSSDSVAPVYTDAARALGTALAQAGHTLLYGGGQYGLMGAVARATQAGGGRVIGVIPEKLLPQGYDAADEMVVTADLRERKAVLEARAEAFVALPGGFGTLEEVLEIVTLKQLGYHDKPIVLLNAGGFFDPLADLFEHLYAEQFVHEDFRVLYHFAPDAAATLAYLATYRPPVLPVKWRSLRN